MVLLWYFYLYGCTFFCTLSVFVYRCPGGNVPAGGDAAPHRFLLIDRN